MSQASHQNAGAGKSRGRFGIGACEWAREFEPQFLLGLLWTLQIIEARIEVAFECRRDQPPEAPAIVTNKLEPALLEFRHIVACLLVVVLNDRDDIAARRGV